MERRRYAAKRGVEAWEDRRMGDMARETERWGQWCRKRETDARGGGVGGGVEDSPRRCPMIIATARSKERYRIMLSMLIFILEAQGAGGLRDTPAGRGGLQDWTAALHRDAGSTHLRLRLFPRQEGVLERGGRGGLLPVKKCRSAGDKRSARNFFLDPQHLSTSSCAPPCPFSAQAPSPLPLLPMTSGSLSASSPPDDFFQICESHLFSSVDSLHSGNEHEPNSGPKHRAASGRGVGGLRSC
jgi:hypothetical protein